MIGLLFWGLTFHRGFKNLFSDTLVLSADHFWKILVIKKGIAL